MTKDEEIKDLTWRLKRMVTTAASYQFKYCEAKKEISIMRARKNFYKKLVRELRG